MVMHKAMHKIQENNLVTLRNLPPQIIQLIRKLALEKGTSLNKAVIALLEEKLEGPVKKKKLHHDLDALAGSWTKQEAAQFEKSLSSQRRIDPELWK